MSTTRVSAVRGVWAGRVVTRARRAVAATLPAPCPFCGRMVEPWQSWDVDHARPRSEGGPLTYGLRAAHASCNRRAGQALATRNRAGLRAWPP